MTDYRALCAELLADFEYVCREYKVPLRVALMKARKALAEGDGVGPTPSQDLTPEHTKRAMDGRLHPDVSAACRYVDGVLDTAGAALLQGGYAWHGWALREAFLAGCSHNTHPRPIPSLDATCQLILRLTAELARLHDSEPQTLDLIAEARAFIDADHPRPIPVAERLPTAADCDAEGRCWHFSFETVIGGPCWQMFTEDELEGLEPSTHWLPAAAIPLPEASP